MPPRTDNPTKIRLIRRAQSLSPYGTGAIIDISGESFVFTDILHWGYNGQRIEEPRLRDYLGVDHFRMAPPAPNDFRDIDENTVGLPVVRFPFWHFCPECRRMQPVDSTLPPPKCSNCGSRLIPMRWVLACPFGHLSDVPWIDWAHSEKGIVCQSPVLEFKTLPGGSGLSHIYIECRTCHEKKPLKGLMNRDAMKVGFGRLGPIYCRGSHPWMKETGKCNAVPIVLQRGASNLIYHKIETSIDIPPFSTPAYFEDDIHRVAAHPIFSAVRSLWNADGRKVNDEDLTTFHVLIKRIAELLGMEEDRAIKAAYLALNPQSTPSVEGSPDPIPGPVRLRLDEYKAFLEPDRVYAANETFAKVTVDFSAYPSAGADPAFATAVGRLKSMFGSVVRITRLREVRALSGFSRLAPPPDEVSDDGEAPGMFEVYGAKGKRFPAVLVPPDLGAFRLAERWLPAVEVFGEGLFFTLNPDALKAWESIPAVRARYEILRVRRDEKARFLPEVSPRLILLHTLSHALLRRLSFECGYALASLRERIYAWESDDENAMGGILIYTAAGDSEGTLGGLVRQGRPERIFPTLLASLQDTFWCSSDPLCRESTGQGPDSCNLAACHACSLIPETACTVSNRLLDRLALIGRPGEDIPGFFSPLLDLIENL